MPGLNRIFTGMRRTILVKLPVALSGGNRLNSEPEAGEKLSTVPSKRLPGTASTRISTGCPGFICSIWVSLKLASTKMPLCKMERA